MADKFTDEKGHTWTLAELLADLDVGDYLYLTPKMCRDLATLLRASTAKPEARAWISVEERMPPKDGKASLAFFPQHGGYVADQRMKPIYWTGEAWQVSISGHNVYEPFTHWMPLPADPLPQGVQE